ncbi:Rieske 2Fe-2S domain-containing protein [Paraburkholderia dilworthii]|uniref:Rieske 2Fe-2S domain-containing protein n=1 Tax=Paraburkholderia dilworthii TaxID=948106 RepID=UPI00042312C6|nr:Rieske 2Fe-2S domain-containing protein [Paraburkholderia dilworthii]
MSDERAVEIDTGTGYGIEQPAYRQELVEVERGTPMGELMRRYWQPFALSEDLTDKPRRVRLLGENLIAFRDKQGRAGLVHERCAHRGTSLYFGRVEEDGIRCCYHGWKFDVRGRCLNQPAEVDGGRHRAKVCQPWYPVEERYGLAYAYMGPPEKKPVLPRWEHLENLADDEYVEVRWKPGYGPRNDQPYNPLNFNFLQAYENSLDAAHLPWLHFHHSGDQFTGAPLMRVDGDDAELPPYAHIKNLAGQIVSGRSELGVKQGVPMPVPGQGLFLASNEAIVPNIAVVATLIDLLYFVPVDNTHYFNFLLFRSKKGQKRGEFDLVHMGKTWWELTEEERQSMPGDYEAQSSIGTLPAHNREHLAQSDVPLALLRRRLAEAVKDVQEGRDPPGVQFGADAPPLRIGAHGMIPYTPATEGTTF